mmetsp:Transcript_52456/g.122387  ORF Transcript_52456/g.122387 Transcript_52456/m.122387 type:complete len:219 (+) Transcript_52456:101-757(+)
MNLDQKFQQALDGVFARWTTLALAVDQGWGGRDSRAKGKQLQVEVVDYLVNASRKRRPPSWENYDDVQELAYYLYLRIDEMFNTETDDGSDKEVATMCLRLFNTCQSGDGSFADQILQACQTHAPQDLSKSQGSERIEYATVEDELLDKMDGMEIEEEDEGGEMKEEQEPDGAMVSDPSELMPTGGYAAPIVKPKPAPEPTVDEDGFTAVVKGHRRPR